MLASSLLLLWVPDAKCSGTIYVDPSMCVFTTRTASAGTRFNVTIWCSDVTDVSGAQIYMEFNDSIINATRWFVPSSDPQFFMPSPYSALPAPPDPNYWHLAEGIGRIMIAVVKGGLPPSPPWGHGGKVAIIEFNITAIPTEPGTKLSTVLHIDNPDTYLLDSDDKEIEIGSKVDSYYEISRGSLCDIAITALEASKNYVVQNRSVSITVTVANQGDGPETFNLTLYIQLYTPVELQTRLVTLQVDEYAVTMFTWNTTGWAIGNYNVTAYAWPVRNETDLADNAMSCSVEVGLLIGDVNGDGTVDLKDVLAVALAYGSSIGNPRYKPNLDINDDGTVDLKDYLITVVHYGM
ncbi:MAG: dockerin type I domain-containing protein [Candidatus Bathyarchaeota archaeon]|nr:dockerin type I domain-containing protein [Candidatus Bathyarchaeota archaeon]